MNISLHPQSLKSNTLGEYATRFLFGGAMCVIAGLIAQRYGPVVGGLALAFPAIFPASATLLVDHEKQKMRKAGRDGTKRGRAAAAVDAEGSAMGCVGLAAFAFTVWRLLPYHATWMSLLIATAAWLVVAGLCWWLRRKV